MVIILNYQLKIMKVIDFCYKYKFAKDGKYKIQISKYIIY